MSWGSAVTTPAWAAAMKARCPFAVFKAALSAIDGCGVGFTPAWLPGPWPFVACVVFTMLLILLRPPLFDYTRRILAPRSRILPRGVARLTVPPGRVELDLIRYKLNRKIHAGRAMFRHDQLHGRLFAAPLHHGPDGCTSLEIHLDLVAPHRRRHRDVTRQVVIDLPPAKSPRGFHLSARGADNDSRCAFISAVRAAAGSDCGFTAA
jgi:hypothetical protein